MENGKGKKEKNKWYQTFVMFAVVWDDNPVLWQLITDWSATVYQQFMASKKSGGREDRLSALSGDNRVKGRDGKHISSSPKTTLAQGAHILCGFIHWHDWNRHVLSCLLVLTSSRMWRDIGKQKVCYPVWIAGIWHSCLTYINFPSTGVLLGGDS